MQVPPETPEPTIKSHERTDVRQLEALNRVDDRTAEERRELSFGVVISPRRLEFRFQNNWQSSRQGRRNPANSEPGLGGK